MQDRPILGKLYALTGKTGAKCIGNGNTWAEGEVSESYPIGGMVEPYDIEVEKELTE